MIKSERFLFFSAGLISIFLSYWISTKETVINPDAICYLLSAQEVGLSGISAAMHLCGQAQWPFYSFLIHQFVQVSHLSYLVSAYVLNGLFTLMSVIFFILIVKALGGSRRVLWLAAATILLAHEFNSVREYIIRDHGFWAFYLASLFFLLCFFAKPTWRTASAWNVSLMIATLFRIEGALFLIVLPFLSWLCKKPWKQRALFFLMLNMPSVLAIFVVALWLYTHQQRLDTLGRLPELANHMLHGVALIYQRFQDTKIALLQQQVLIFQSTNQLTLVLIVFFTVWYVFCMIGNLSWVYFALVLYAWRQRVTHFTFAATLVLAGYALVNILATYGFLMERLFLSKRYLIALSLIGMLWVPFALDHLLQKRSITRYRIGLLVAIFFIFISSLSGIVDFGYSKAYLRNAGDWLAKNVPSHAALYTNDYQLMYYSQHFGREIFANLHERVNLDIIAQDQWKHYDYIALRLDKKKAAEITTTLQKKQLVLVQIFKNKRDDQVVIYRRAF